MRKTILSILWGVTILLIPLAWSSETDSAQVEIQAAPDTLSSVKGGLTDTLLIEKESGQIMGQEAKITPEASKKDSIIVVKHSFDHKEQVIVGGVIMASLALILVSMNNYNPK